ncbi:MAG TPA: DUF1552 domain-containing protein [Polyangiales bacterium]
MKLSRRALLRGAGVCLALPYLESLAPRAKAQAAPLKRLVVCYFPNGTSAAHWPVSGTGSDFALSPILQPLASHKTRMSVFTNLENYSSMQADQGVEPSHSRLCGAFLTCVDADKVTSQLKVEIANGISMDQVIAQKQSTPLRSLELGLSTLNSSTDGRHPALSRSIAWASPTQPLYKEVNPQAVFDRLVASGATEGVLDPQAAAQAARRRALRLSALDFVRESASSLSAKLGREDRPKLEEYLTAVRSLEQRTRNLSADMDAQSNAMCKLIARPTQAYALNVSDGYSRATHASLMNELIVMALRCDVTRVITHMLDDARSDFVYDHVTQRKFSLTGSVEGSGPCGGYHGLQHAGDSNDGFASINWWFSSQMAALCDLMSKVPEGEGTLLDHTLIVYGGAMHGGDHDARPLPMALLGGTKAGIRANQHLDYTDIAAGKPLRDLYYTIIKGYFGIDIASFGTSLSGQPNQLISELLT